MAGIIDKIVEFFHSIVNGNYLGLIAVLISSSSLLFAYFVYRKNRANKKTKLLNSKRATYNVINKNNRYYEKVEIKYENKTLDVFSSTIITIKNSGTDVIKKEDIAKQAPIKIILDDKYEILEYRIKKKPNKISKIGVNQKENNLIINFDFIESGESLKIEILHTAESSKSFSIEGKIIGTKEEIEDISIEKKILNSGTKWRIGLVGFLMFVLFFVFPTIIISYIILNLVENQFLRIILFSPIIYFAYIIFKILFKVATSKKKKKAVSYEEIMKVYINLMNQELEEDDDEIDDEEIDRENTVANNL